MSRPTVRIDIEPVRVPGEAVWRPWFCIVRHPGKAAVPTGRKFTEAAARRAADRLARQLAAGRPYVVEVQ